MSLGKRLNHERTKRNWSQKFVAEKIGITNTVLSNYERNYRDPDTTTLRQLAELYEVSTDYLLGHSTTPSMSEQEEFEAFVNNPTLKRWYKELPESEEEDLEALRQIWEVIKKDKK